MKKKKKIKLLLYCSKGKVGLYDNRKKITGALENFFLDKFGYDKPPLLNGKIAGECDFEVEDIYYGYEIDDFWTKTCGSQKDIKHNLLKQSCLTDDEMYQYLQPKDSYYGDCGKAIHIKNLHIFDKPRELAHSTTDNDSYYYTEKDDKKFKVIRCSALIQAPQNMMYACDYYGNPFVLISIRPELMYKILNGECTIIVKKKVLKGMIENDK